MVLLAIRLYFFTSSLKGIFWGGVYDHSVINERIISHPALYSKVTQKLTKFDVCCWKYISKAEHISTSREFCPSPLVCRIISTMEWSGEMFSKSSILEPSKMNSYSKCDFQPWQNETAPISESVKTTDSESHGTAPWFYGDRRYTQLHPTHSRKPKTWESSCSVLLNRWGNQGQRG